MEGYLYHYHCATATVPEGDTHSLHPAGVRKRRSLSVLGVGRACVGLGVKRYELDCVQRLLPGEIRQGFRKMGWPLDLPWMRMMRHQVARKALSMSLHWWVREARSVDRELDRMQDELVLVGRSHNSAHKMTIWNYSEVRH